MSSISIRPATPNDIAAITRIYGHAVMHGTASFEIEPPSEAEMARRQQELFDSGATIVNIHTGQQDQKRAIEFYGSKVLPHFAAHH